MKSNINVRLLHWRMLCPEPLYAKRSLESYIGRLVKIGFQSSNDATEYMWVKVDSVDGPNLVGTLDNEPETVDHVSYGDVVTFSRLQIISMDLSPEEWWEEVCSLRAQGDYFNPHLGFPCEATGFGGFFAFKFTPRQSLESWVCWSPDGGSGLEFLSDIAERRQHDR